MGAIQKALITRAITHLTGANGYTRFHYRDDTNELFSKTLRYFEQQLPHFIRIHKGVLVNPVFVDIIQVPITEGPNGSLVLKTGLVLPISYRRMSCLRASLASCQVKITFVYS